MIDKLNMSNSWRYHWFPLTESRSLAYLERPDTVPTLEHGNEGKASNLNRGLLINFGSRQLQYKRLVFNLRESA